MEYQSLCWHSWPGIVIRVLMDLSNCQACLIRVIADGGAVLIFISITSLLRDTESTALEKLITFVGLLMWICDS